MKTKVAAIQMTSTENIEDNLEQAFDLCHQAIQEGAHLTIVPECFFYLGPDRGKPKVAEPLPEGGVVLKRCIEFVQKTRSELILGGFWERSQTADKVFNTSIHLGADGTIKTMYRKIHMFDVTLPDGVVLKESETVDAGQQPIVTDAPFGKLGLSICYDLRFPELYRRLVDMGAIALAVPAAFTLTTGKDHWHVLLRARAIESQAYVIAAAQTGHHFGSRTSYGHALICDPWGCVISECGEGPGYAIANIEPNKVEQIRKSLPSLDHRVL